MFVGLTRVPDLCFSLLSVSASVPVFLRHVFFISDTHTHTHTHTHTAFYKPSVLCFRVEICTPDLILKV